jgi:hypothetical protein
VISKTLYNKVCQRFRAAGVKVLDMELHSTKQSELEGKPIGITHYIVQIDHPKRTVLLAVWDGYQMPPAQRIKAFLNGEAS